MAVVGLGAAPAAAAPFVYVVNGPPPVDPYFASIAQFDAPLAGFGALQPLTPATAYIEDGASSVVISPDGKSAYGLLNGGDSIHQYNIDPTTGRLSDKSPAHVDTDGNPAAIALSPDGKSAYVANMFDKTVSQYNVNQATGKLRPKKPATVAAGNYPSAVAVSPDGKSAYVTNLGDSTVSQYDIDPSTGALSPKKPATVSTEAGMCPPNPEVEECSDDPVSVAVTPDADVSVKLRAPASITRGSELTYAITVSNAGPSRAWQVKLTDRLPSGTEFVKTLATRVRCASPKPGIEGKTVTCELGKLKRGKSQKIRIVVKVSASAHKSTIADLAKVRSVTPDPLTSNNTATVQTTLRE